METCAANSVTPAKVPITWQISARLARLRFELGFLNKSFFQPGFTNRAENFSPVKQAETSCNRIQISAG